MTPAPASYAAPGRYMFLAANTSTGASTLAVNGLAGSPKNIKRLDGSNVQAGDIVTSKIADVVYDGAEFVLLNPRSLRLPGNWTVAGHLTVNNTAHFNAVTAATVTATTHTVNWGSGNKQELTLQPSVGNNVGLSFTDPPGPCSLILTLKQDASGSRTVTWPTSPKLMKWSFNAAPTLSTGANKVDVIPIYYDGTFYYGSFLEDML